MFISYLALLGCFVSLIAAETHTWYYNANWTTANPDGLYEREVIGFNGSWPLPILRVNKGDTINLYLTNGFTDGRNTSLHFHGLFQEGSNQMDGPEMVTQCPIPPGETFLYNFTVTDQAGTYWYHSHTSGQFGDGMRAAFIIEDTEPLPFEYDEEIVLTVAEWYHETSDVIMPTFLSLYNPTGAEPIPDSFLFNETYNSTWNVKPNTTYFLRIVNVGRFVSQYLFIEDHEMEVVEVDGIFVNGNTTDMIYITTAQRYGVLVRTKEDTSKNFAFMMSCDTTMLDTLPPDLSVNVTTPMVYDANNAAVEEYFVDEYDILDDFYLTPVSDIPLLPEADQIITLDVVMNNLDNGVNYAFFNNITYTKPKVPTLHTVLSAGNLSSNAVIYGDNTHSFVLQSDEIVDIVLNNHDTGTHPFHLHGHVFQVIARGEAVDDSLPPVDFNYTTAEAFPERPMIRDTVYARPQSFFVIRFKASNPGVWFFHCHIEWHLDQGLAITLIEAPELIQSNDTQQLTDGHKQICTVNGGAYEGNAAGNMNFLDLTGQNVQVKDLPAGFTARGIVALVFSCISAFLGMGAIAYYGMSDIKDIEARVARDLAPELEAEAIKFDEEESEEVVERSSDTQSHH